MSELPDNNSVAVFDKETVLTITNSTSEDSGIYRVTAENKAGASTDKCKVIVQGKTLLCIS